MSDIFNVLSALACFLSIAAVFFAARSATQLRELQDQLQRCNPSRIKSIETSLADTRDALEVVANRVKMMRVRSAANHVPDKNGAADPYRDPNAWRAEMNKRLAFGKLPIANPNR